MASQIVLIVDGLLIRDDGNVVAIILQQARALAFEHAGLIRRTETYMSQLSDALDGFKTSIDTFIADVETLLTMPNPDVSAALDRLSDMKQTVDAEDAKVRAAEQPQVP